jgi:hypothetical protein
VKSEGGDGVALDALLEPEVGETVFTSQPLVAAKMLEKAEQHCPCYGFEPVVQHAGSKRKRPSPKPKPRKLKFKGYTKRTVYTFSDEQKPRLRQMLLAQCEAARAKHRHMTSDHLTGGKYDPGSSLCTPLIKRLLAKCDRTNGPAETVQGMKDRIDTNFKNLGALATQGLTMARYNNAFGTGGSFLQMDKVYRAAAYRVAKRMLPVDRQRAKEAAAKQAAAEEEETRKSAREREKRVMEKAAKQVLWGLQAAGGRRGGGAIKDSS